MFRAIVADECFAKSSVIFSQHRGYDAGNYPNGHLLAPASSPAHLVRMVTRLGMYIFSTVQPFCASKTLRNISTYVCVYV